MPQQFVLYILLFIMEWLPSPATPAITPARTACAPGAIKHLLEEYTFIGLAPRYLLAELKGGVTVKSLYKSTWDSLRVLQAAVVETFGVSHAMPVFK